MIIVIDYLLDDANDLIIDPLRGDFAKGESEEQNISHILRANLGEWRQWPLLGIGLINYLASPWDKRNQDSLRREIRLQLTSDNLQVGKLEVGSPEGIAIEADRIR